VLEPQVVSLATELSSRLHVAQNRHASGVAALNDRVELVGTRVE
jgi:hypothetical protein